MDYQTKLNEQLQIIVGKRLDNLHLVCELMSFAFEEYAFHALGLTRIIHENNILVTTIDYLNWDGEQIQIMTSGILLNSIEIK